MSKGIMVEIPENVYVSYDPGRTVENEFYFTIYKEYQSKRSRVKTDDTVLLLSPQIYICGFEQLLKIEQPTPEKQEEQLTEAVGRFLESLICSDSNGTCASDWKADYQYEKRKETLSIVLAYTGEELPEDFSVKFSSSDFICNTVDTSKALALTVHTEGFETVFEDAKDYEDYRIHTEVRYAPCITRFIARYSNQEQEKRFYVSPAWDDKVEFFWEIAGNGRIEHRLLKDEIYMTEASAGSSVADTVKQDTVYTLEAFNQKGFKDTAQIEVKVTNWHMEGMVTGLFEHEDLSVAGKGNIRIFFYENRYYCYRGRTLFLSSDGCCWSVFSENSLLPTEEGFICISGEMQGKMLYLMGGVPGKRLKIISYDFVAGTWSINPANQNCISEKGKMVFSTKKHYYAQITPYGISVNGHSTDGDWEHWDSEGFEINPDGYKIKDADLCFWKEFFYAAVLGDDEKCYFYRCDENVEDALFVLPAGMADKVSLLGTQNGFYLILGERIYDAVSRKLADRFFPTEEGMLAVGANKEQVFGISVDNSFWIYKETS